MVDFSRKPRSNVQYKLHTCAGAKAKQQLFRPHLPSLKSRKPGFVSPENNKGRATLQGKKSQRLFKGRSQRRASAPVFASLYRAEICNSPGVLFSNQTALRSLVFSLELVSSPTTSFPLIVSRKFQRARLRSIRRRNNPPSVEDAS